jgi:hypothetical protein
MYSSKIVTAPTLQDTHFLHTKKQLINLPLDLKTAAIIARQAVTSERANWVKDSQ